MSKQIYPLTAEVLNEFKSAIKFQSEEFRTNQIRVDSVLARGGRGQIKHAHYPIRAAFDYFENEGAGKIVSDWRNWNMGLPVIFEILNSEYFEIDFGALDLPITFSIDERIKTDLISMIEIYAHVYDSENRLRFFLTQRLETKYGKGFFKDLPKKVRENIETQKRRSSVFIEDTRIKDLEYSYFTDMKRILVDNDDFVANSETRAILTRELEYLAEARNYTAHNSRLLPEEIIRVKESCSIVRRIVED